MPQYLTIEPNECLADQEVKIQINGLQGNQNVTIYAVLNRSDIGIFESFAKYTVDDNGFVDLSSHASLGGSYAGVESMGLFWSMKPSPNNKRRNIRFIIRDVEKPIEVRIRVFEGHLSHEELAESTREVLVEGSVIQWYKRSDVRRIPVRWKRVRGTLFVPHGVGPFPTVIDIYGTTGGLIEHRAALLASRGFLCFALAYFDFEDLPKTPSEIDLGYFEEAKDFLQTRPECSKGQIGLVGSSLGGTLALACVAYLPGFTCAAVVSTRLFLVGSTLRYNDRIWPAIQGNSKMSYEMDGAISKKYEVDEYYSKESSGDSLIEFAQCDKSFLFIFGHDDDLFNAPKTLAFLEELIKDSRGSFKIVIYPKTGHVIQPPYSPHTSSTYSKLAKLRFKWGGVPKMHCRAQELAWKEIIAFLNENLPKKSSKL